MLRCDQESSALALGLQSAFPDFLEEPVKFFVLPDHRQIHCGVGYDCDALPALDYMLSPDITACFEAANKMFNQIRERRVNGFMKRHFRSIT